MADNKIPVNYINPGNGVPQRRRIFPIWLWVFLGVLAILFCCGGVAAIMTMDGSTERGTLTTSPAETGDEVISNSRNDAHPPVEDVEITNCGLNTHGWIDVDLEITNHSSKASDYAINIEVVNGREERVETVFTFVSALRPDQTERVDAGGLEDLSAYNSIECRLLEVDRWAAE